MGFTAVKCPSCGADVRINDGSESGYCEFCGSKVMQEKIIVEHRIDESGKYNNLVRLAHNAFTDGNYGEAYEYYARAREISQGDILIIFRKAICAGYISEGGEKNNEVISGIEAALAEASQKEVKDYLLEITKLVTGRKIDRPSEFIGADSCKKYVYDLMGHIRLADMLYRYVDSDDRATVESFCRVITDGCEIVGCEEFQYIRKADENKKFKFNLNLSLDGLSIDNLDKREELFYEVPSDILEDAERLSEKYDRESKKFVMAELNGINDRLVNAKQTVKALPIQFNVLHCVFSIPAIIIALLFLFVKPVVGIVLFAVIIGAYIAYIKMDTDKAAQNAYQNLRDVKEEYNKTKTKLNQ